jgi:hypothetical protein
VRASAARTQCANNLRQLGLGLHAYYHTYHAFPQGYRANDPNASNWLGLILPYVEQGNLQALGQAGYETHTVAMLLCPSDPRGALAGGYGHYLAVEGTNYNSEDGVLFHDSRIDYGDIKDGLSNTVLVGERPPSPDLFWGRWAKGPFHSALGARNTQPVNTYSSGPRAEPGATTCRDRLPGAFGPGRVTDYCDTHHFWSFHPGGGHWVLADSSVRFLSYEAAPLIPKLATRAGGEVVDLSPY